jgi:hypothetical protein
MKTRTQFTNKNTHILLTDTLQKHAMLLEAFFYWGAENEGLRAEEIFKFRVSEMPFPGL